MLLNTAESYAILKFCSNFTVHFKANNENNLEIPENS